MRAVRIDKIAVKTALFVGWHRDPTLKDNENALFLLYTLFGAGLRSCLLL